MNRLSALSVSAARAEDFAAIEQVMTDTLALGERASGVDASDYVRSCVSVYRDIDGTSAVVCRSDDAEIVGYALIGLDPARVEHRSRRAARHLALRIGWRGFVGQLNRPTRRFYGARCRDIAQLSRGAHLRSSFPHAHVNVVRGHRSGRAALALVAHIDDVVRDAGFAMWLGEMNERRGQRIDALERLGFEILHRSPNITLSMLCDTDVDRLTIARRI